MNWFGRKKIAGEAQAAGSAEAAAAGQWATLEQMPDLATAQRQQRKIISGVLYGAEQALMQHDAAITADDFEHYVTALGTGEIGQKDERNFLEKIQSPLRRSGEAAVFAQKMENDKHQKRILAQMAGAGFSHYETADAETLRNFAAMYPLPMDFEAVSAEFLNAIQKQNTAEKYQEYVGAMAEFKRNVYGKRQEYWEQMKSLRQEAQRRMLENEPTQRLETQQHTSEDEPTQQLLRRLQRREGEKLLKRGQIDGDEWLQDGRKYQLTTETLGKLGLAPQYETELDGTKIALSKTFAVGSRLGVMAYVQNETGVHVRSYYQSNSQGMWRYLPDYVSNGSGKIDWYGKGYSEEMLTLPAKMQEHLTRVAQEGPLKLEANSDYVLGGTAKRYATKNDYRAAMYTGTLRGDVYQEVARNPQVDFGELSHNKRPPEMAVVQGEQAPDFGCETAEWTMRTSLAGDVRAYSYAAKDRTLEYTFCQDKAGRAWVATIGTNAPVTSTGLRSEWVSGGDLVTPLYEYAQQAGGYADPDDSRQGGRYVAMWSRYLAKMPIIQEFLKKH